MFSLTLHHLNNTIKLVIAFGAVATKRNPKSSTRPPIAARLKAL